MSEKIHHYPAGGIHNQRYVVAESQAICLDQTPVGHSSCTIADRPEFNQHFFLRFSTMDVIRASSGIGEDWD